MAVPQIPLTMTMADVQDENSFTLGKLQTSSFAVSFTAAFDTFQATWGTTNAARNALVITLGKADGTVSAADDTLDDFVDTLDHTLLPLVHNDRTNPAYTLYFTSETPSVLKRPILGKELATVEEWIPLLTGSPYPTVSALAPALTTAVATANAAVTAQKAAAQALKEFDATGPKAQLIASFNALRLSTYGSLAAIPHQNQAAMLPPTFGDRFFRHVTAKGLTGARTVAEAQEHLTSLQKKAAIVQNHLANLTAAETAHTAAKATAATAKTTTAAAKKAATTAKKAAKAAEVAEKEAKLKARKRR